MSFIMDLIRQEHLPVPVQFIPGYDKDVVLRCVCAFLNSDGGWIVVGVNQDRKIVGLSEDNSADDLQAAITNSISPIPLVYIQNEVCEGKKVLLLTVMKGSMTPYAYNGRFYVSQGDMIIIPDIQQLHSLLRSGGSIQDKWELMTCMRAEESDIDSELMGRIYSKGKNRNRVIADDENQLSTTLRRLHLLGSSTVSNGAMALFGTRTAFFLNQCRVRIQIMLDGKTAQKYQDVRIIEDNMFVTHQKVLDYFNDLPKTASFADKRGYREDSFIYPPEVIDEAITNALIHRSYNGLLEEITVFIYRDKVEISNPGEMLGNFFDKDRVKPHGSVLRNPVMAEIFFMSGLMEKSGRGLSLICDGMYGAGCKRPMWKSENGKTTLTIYSTKIKKAEINERMLQFIAEHSLGDVFAKSDYAERFGVSKITAQTDIQRMMELNYCQQKGKGPSTKYIITKLTDR